MGHLRHKKVRCHAQMGSGFEGLSKRSGLRPKRFVEEPLQRNAGVDDVEQLAGTVVPEFANRCDRIGHRAVLSREALMQFIDAG
jgi:hypothetical protein